MLRLHKLRAFLTMLGVIIGVMSVTIIVMISNGFQSYIKGQFSKIGSDTIFVSYAPWRMRKGDTAGGIEKLTLEDAQFLRDRVPSIDIVSAARELGTQTAKVGDLEVKDIRVTGIDETISQLMKVDISSGRNINHDDLVNFRSVAMLSEDSAKAIFGTTSAVGKTFLVGPLNVEVVGVFVNEQSLGQRNTKSMWVPVSTVNKKWLGGEQVDDLMIKPKEGSSVKDTMDQIWQTLMEKSNNVPIYSVDSSEGILSVFQGIIGAAGGILAAVAALSLLVGGIGIMNIMLVSVTERTREIGLRKAVGAKSSAVLLQFLIEAGTLSLIGGLIGMSFAFLLGQGVTALTMQKGWPDKHGLALPFPLTAALGSAAFSALIGMIFGFFPAISASRLDPIVALRSE